MDEYQYKTLTFKPFHCRIRNIPHRFNGKAYKRTIRVELRLIALLSYMKEHNLTEYDFQEFDRGIFGR